LDDAEVGAAETLELTAADAAQKMCGFAQFGKWLTDHRIMRKMMDR
jgi:hypothetical protein